MSAARRLRRNSPTLSSARCNRPAAPLFHPLELEALRLPQLAIFEELPFADGVFAIYKAECAIVHVERTGSGQVGYVPKFEFQLAAGGIVCAGFHAGLVSKHAIVRQQKAGTI